MKETAHSGVCVENKKQQSGYYNQELQEGKNGCRPVRLANGFGNRLKANNKQRQGRNNCEHLKNAPLSRSARIRGVICAKEGSRHAHERTEHQATNKNVVSQRKCGNDKGHSKYYA